jgi:conjugal transfer/entry exclusion protein
MSCERTHVSATLQGTRYQFGSNFAHSLSSSITRWQAACSQSLGTVQPFCAHDCLNKARQTSGMQCSASLFQSVRGFLPGLQAAACLCSATADQSLERIEKELDNSIRMQRERIEKMDKAFRDQAKAGPWRLFALGTSGVALLCAWRLVKDKREYEVRNYSWIFHICK